MPCRWYLPFSSPSSVIAQCFTDFLVFFRILSKNLLTALVHISLPSSCSFSLNLLKFSLLIVSVTNNPLLSFRISSDSLVTHSRCFCFLHSIHLPHLTGTYKSRLSWQTGGFPLFFLLGLYFGFNTYLVYKHILFTF